MISPLVLKTFSDLDYIEYKESFVRPAYGHTIWGTIFLPLIIVFILMSNPDFRVYLLLCSVLIILTVFVISLIKTSTLKKVIFNASKNNSKNVEINGSYNGEKRFFPLGPSAGIVMGIVLNSILRNFVGFDIRSTVCAILLSICAGLFLGVGLTYLYFERKIRRPIKVQRYIKKPKKQ